MKTHVSIRETPPSSAPLGPKITSNDGEWRPMLIIGALLALLYFLTARLVAPTDGASHSLYALTEALTTEHRSILDHFVTGGGGFLASAASVGGLAYYAGHYYTTIAPGSALIALPFLAVGRFFGEEGGPAFVSGLTALAGAATVVVFYGLARRLGSAIRSARYAALTLGLASVLWREAGRFGPGVFSLFLLTLALCLAVPPLPQATAPEGGRRLVGWRAVALGLTLGFSVVVDYPNLLWTPLILGYLLWQRRFTRQSWLLCGSAWLVGIAPLAIYNGLNFGRPWTFSYSFGLGDPHSRSLVGQFLKGLGTSDPGQVLFGPGRASLGLFVLLFGVWGLVALYGQRGKRADALLAGGLVVVGLLEGFLRYNERGGVLRADFALAMIPALGVGVAVWHERFMFLTRLEQWWLPTLALVGPALYYWLSAPGLIPNGSGLVYGLPLIGLVSMVAFVWWRTPSLAGWRKSYGLVAAMIVVGLGLTLVRETTRPTFAESGSNNLLTNGGLKCEGATVPGWYRQGQLLKCFTPGQPYLAAGQDLQPYLAAVQGGKSYSLRLDSAGPGRLDWLWLDDNQQAVAPPGGEISQSICGSCRYGDERAAPPGAAYLQLVFRASAGGGLTNVALFDNGVRLEPMPNYARAALAFSFDWESAMGGLIHSKGGGPAAGGEGESDGTAVTEANVQSAVNNAVVRGNAMRAGADYLLKLFGMFEVRGTFYATGYDLLDGNRDHNTFADNPTYTWAAPKNRWPSDYWQTHPWYVNDPYGDYGSDPAWYFGDQTNRLREAGQDIQDHTFGHLYVRGTTLAEFQADQAEFLRYAADKNLTIRHFAFPWKSSNSVKPPWYAFLADQGFQSVTRLYDQDQQIFVDGVGRLKFDNGQRTAANTVVAEEGAGPKNYYYYLRQAPGEARLLALHDYQLVPGEASESQARQLIDELLRRRGYGSVWTHPEAVVTPGDQAQWLRVVQYAVQKRAEGLWVDSVANIVQRRLDTARVEVSSEWRDGGQRLRVTLTNPTDHVLEGITLTMPAPIQAAPGASGFKGAQLVAPTLPAGQTLSLEVEF